MMPCKGKAFLEDFVKRTKQNYENADEEYKITQLINSSVALLIVPKEIEYALIEDSDIPSALLNKLRSQPWLRKYTYSEPLNLRQIARHIKNAISHGNFDFMSDDPYIGEGHPIITHIQFKDKNMYKNANEEFEIIIPIADWKDFLFTFSDAIVQKALH